MKIRLLSDIHTEFGLPYQTHEMSEYQGEDVLVLAGDIASGSSNTMKVIRDFKARGFPNIIFVPGNHEYYGTSFADFNTKMATKSASVPGVHVLNPGVITIGDVLFIGATLWSNFADNPISQGFASRGISDFRLIKGFTTRNCAELYYEHVEFIKHQYENRGTKKIVVVTHFLPARECISERWRGPNLLNDYFANDLGGYIASMSDTTWMFGHTHDAVDIMLGDTRVVANPHGYYKANDGTGFEAMKTITL